MTIGSASYSGDAIMLIEASDLVYEVNDTITKFAKVSMSIDFEANSGEINVISNDGKSQVTSKVNTYAGTWLEGSGTFTTAGDTYKYLDLYSRYYNAISEPTRFEGTLTGSVGQGAAGIFLGDSHVVGVSVE